MIVRFNNIENHFFVLTILLVLPSMLFAQQTGTIRGKVSDSRFGTRMKGEGNYAELIRTVFHASRKKYFTEVEKRPLRKDIFRTNGNLNLF